MPVTERLMAAGQWNLQLDPATPKSTRDLIDFFGHIYVFDSPVRPGLADASLITLSRWGGVVRRRQTPFDVSGANMITWLGDEDGKGPVLEVAIGAVTNFLSYVNAFLAICPAVTAGTATGGAGPTFGPIYNQITVRQALDNACTIFGMEYRVNKDATLDYAPVGNSAMFKQTPTAVAMRRSSGRDLNVTGLPVIQLGVAIDSEEYYIRALVEDSAGTWHGVSGSATTYKDLHGNALLMTKPVVNPSAPAASATQQATNLVAASELLRNEVTLTSDLYNIDRDVVIGDYIWVYDPDSNMVDATNQIPYRGSVIFPIKLRALGMTWPIERGMSVFYRDKAGVWTDLTNYVLFESPGVSFEVGAGTRQLLVKP